MNKETNILIEYINKSGYALDRIDKLRQQYTNIKDFHNQFGYLIMEILNEEKKFINLSRKNIELPILVSKYFERN